MRDFIRVPLFVLVLALGLMACQSEAPPEPTTLTPSHGDMSGYYRVSIELPDGIDPALVTEVKFGGIKAYDFASPYQSNLLQVTVQGHPEPGEVEVSLTTADTTVTLDEKFTYDPPRLEGFKKLHAVGASLTQGTQRGVPTKWSITHGPARLLAGQLGVYFPLPVLNSSSFSEMSPDLMGPPPYCAPPALNDFQMDQAAGVVEAVTDPDTGEFFFADLRVDPDLVSHNFAVGGSRVGHMLNGPPAGSLALHFISHLAYDPTGTLFDPVKFSQMDMVDAASPELIVSFDLLGNDLIDGMINDSDFSAEGMTPTDVFVENVVKIVDRLAATGAQVFVATLPSPTYLPFFHAKRARLASEGLTENAAIVFEAIETGVAAGNAKLKEQGAVHDNVHVVDLAAQVDQWSKEGVKVGDETLTISQYGGLVGLDGLHFTDTAYALIANVFIEKIEEVLGAQIPRLDLGAIWAQDRERPEALKAEGFDTSACDDFSEGN